MKPDLLSTAKDHISMGKSIPEELIHSMHDPDELKELCLALNNRVDWLYVYQRHFIKQLIRLVRDGKNS